MILSNISKIEEFSFLNCSNLECIQYFGTKEPNISQNAFQGCTILKYIYTNLIYYKETFGSFEVQKTSEQSYMCSSERSGLKDGEIACIVIFSFIFIVIICVILFFTVFRRNKHNKEKENTP